MKAPAPATDPSYVSESGISAGSEKFYTPPAYRPAANLWLRHRIMNSAPLPINPLNWRSLVRKNAAS
ncbi:MAG: hypothetical protein Fues2KO_51590 [Fuerstiella sp.]